MGGMLAVIVTMVQFDIQGVSPSLAHIQVTLPRPVFAFCFFLEPNHFTPRTLKCADLAEDLSPMLIDSNPLLDNFQNKNRKSIFKNPCCKLTSYNLI